MGNCGDLILALRSGMMSHIVVLVRDKTAICVLLLQLVSHIIYKFPIVWQVAATLCTCLSSYPPEYLLIMNFS